MTRHHLRHREPGWRVSLVLNGIGAVISLFVVVIVFATRFARRLGDADRHAGCSS